MPNTQAQLTVNPLPTLSITATRTQIAKGETATLSVSGANTYTWFNTANTPSIIVSSTANAIYVYSVTGTDLNGCKNTAQISIKVFYSGINTINETINTIHLYPNPNAGSFSIKNESALENLNLEIYNALGQLVFITELNKNDIEINSRLAKGIYYYYYYYAIKQNTEALKAGKLIVE